MRWLVVLAVLCAASAVQAQDRWERRKGDCDRTLRGWRDASLEGLANCVMTWEMYRDVKQVDGDWRSIVHGAFDRLYQDGDRRQAHMALSALKRLGLRPKKLRDEAAPVDRSRKAVVETAPVDPGPAVDPKRARTLYSQGVRAYKDGDVPEALAYFLDSADADPLYPQPLYRAAQAYVRLGKGAPAIEALIRMKAIDSDTSNALIERARDDQAFARLQRSSEFKALTGLALIQILNGAGTKGQEDVKRFKAELETAGMVVGSVSDDQNPRQNTYIYSRPGFEQAGERVRRQLKMGLVHSRTIDWNTEYDVILVYGEPEKTAWVDDEAEKAGKAAADKKKAEDAKARKAAEEKAAAKADMKKKLEMLKMMQELESEDATGAVDPTSQDPVDAL